MTKTRQEKYHLASLLVLIALIFVPNISFANAGMIVTSEHDNQTYVLLVKAHKSESFTFPGGKVNFNSGNHHDDDESSYQAAIRETMEETRGYLTQTLLTQASSAYNMIQVKNHALYLAKIPFFSTDEILNINPPKDKAWKAMREIDDYAWVNITEFSKAPDRFLPTLDGREIKLKKIVKEAILFGQIKDWF